MQFAGRSDDAARARARSRATAWWSTTTDDIAGAELCSALKNAYATGLGPVGRPVGAEAHNARAACFTQAIVEMRALVVAAGGRAGDGARRRRAWAICT